jgi:hypothetical protein
MTSRTAACCLACALLGFAPVAARAADWRPVPGAPEVGIDLASWQQERSRVVVWVRWAGRAPFAQDPAAPRPLRVHRTAVLAEFDCARRTVRALATSAHDSAGVPVFMSSLPQPSRPALGGELGWTYDAVCDAARASQRG